MAKDIYYLFGRWIARSIPSSALLLLVIYQQEFLVRLAFWLVMFDAFFRLTPLYWKIIKEVIKTHNVYAVDYFPGTVIMLGVAILTLDWLPSAYGLGFMAHVFTSLFVMGNILSMKGKIT